MSDKFIAKIHYITLEAIYDTLTRSYEELLDLSGKRKPIRKNVRILMVEVYKCFNGIGPPFSWDYF